MDLLFPAMIAATVAMLIWGIWRLTADPAAREKRRLSQRLSGQGNPAARTSEVVSKSIVRQMDVVGVPPALARHPMIQSLNRRLLQAYPQATLGKFLMIAAGTGFAGMVIAMGVSSSLFPGVIGLIAGAYVPFFLLNSKRVKRQRQMALQLPEALDFLSRVLKAGHSFSTGLQMMADELPAPLSEEIQRCYDQHSLGQPLEESLRDTAMRIDSTDFAFFVTALLISRQTGGDLSEVLGNIGGMIRSRVRLAQQVKAKTAEGRFTGYILVAFPAAMFMLCYTQNPDYCNKLLHGTGLYFLGAAFTLQMMGLYAIRKITTIRV